MITTDKLKHLPQKVRLKLERLAFCATNEPDWTDVFRNKINKVLSDQYFDEKRCSHPESPNTFRILDIGGNADFTKKAIGCLYEVGILENANLVIHIIGQERVFFNKYRENVSLQINSTTMQINSITIERLLTATEQNHKISSIPNELEDVLKLRKTLCTNNDNFLKDTTYDLILAPRVVQNYNSTGIPIAYILGSDFLHPKGLAWFVAPDRKSSVYQHRAKILSDNKLPDINYHCFADSFVDRIRCLTKKLTLIPRSHSCDISSKLSSKRKNQLIQSHYWLSMPQSSRDLKRAVKTMKTNDAFLEEHILYDRINKIESHEAATIEYVDVVGRCLYHINKNFRAYIINTPYINVSSIFSDNPHGVRYASRFDIDEPIINPGDELDLSVVSVGCTSVPYGKSENFLESYFNSNPSFLLYDRFFIELDTEITNVGNFDNYTFQYLGDWSPSLHNLQIKPFLDSQPLSVPNSNNLCNAAYNLHKELIDFYELGDGCDTTHSLYSINIGANLHSYHESNDNGRSRDEIRSRLGVFVLVSFQDKPKPKIHIVKQLLSQLKIELSKSLSKIVLGRLSRRQEMLDKTALMNPFFNQAIVDGNYRECALTISEWALKCMDGFHATLKPFRNFTNHGARHLTRVLKYFQEMITYLNDNRTKEDKLFAEDRHLREQEYLAMYLAIFLHEIGMLSISTDTQDNEGKIEYIECVRALHAPRGMLLLEGENDKFWSNYKDRDTIWRAFEMLGETVATDIRLKTAVLVGYHARFFSSLKDEDFLDYSKSITQDKRKKSVNSASEMGMFGWEKSAESILKCSLKGIKKKLNIEDIEAPCNLEEEAIKQEKKKRLQYFAAILRVCDAIDIQYTRNPPEYLSKHGPFIFEANIQDRETLKQMVCKKVEIVGGRINIYMFVNAPKIATLNKILWIMSEKCVEHICSKNDLENLWDIPQPSKLEFWNKQIQSWLDFVWMEIRGRERYESSEKQIVNQIRQMLTSNNWIKDGNITIEGVKVLASMTALLAGIEITDEYEAIKDVKLDGKIKLGVFKWANEDDKSCLEKIDEIFVAINQACAGKKKESFIHDPYYH